MKNRYLQAREDTPLRLVDRWHNINNAVIATSDVTSIAVKAFNVDSADPTTAYVSTSVGTTNIYSPLRTDDLWKDDNGNDFYSSGGRAGESKRELYVDARELVREGIAEFNDPETVRELLTIVEKVNGRIEAQGDGHDDLADATVLAWRCWKDYARGRSYRLERSDGKIRVMEARRRSFFGSAS